jgi:hypothetical protein
MVVDYVSESSCETCGVTDQTTVDIDSIWASSVGASNSACSSTAV